MPPAESRVALLEELRVARAGGDSDQLHTTLDRWSLRPLTGGRNNHVYVWDDPHRGPTCIKIYYRVDDRRRADREWSTLTLLAEHGVTDVPRPLWIDRNGAEPAIGMSLLDGVPLLQSPNLPAALKNMTHTVQRIQAVPRPDCWRSWTASTQLRITPSGSPSCGPASSPSTRTIR
ncbi:phosphotransferase [Dactylosporangium darangshiense]|uniref:phosphotransferase n=1 Tax=Dactylosporangium darangshiense TaxID=579108 RepID=UPI003628D31B